MKIEVFHVPGCVQCGRAMEPLKATARASVAGVSWREISVLDDLDRAVELGVLTLPAFAIDGELVFAALPTPEQLARELVRRMADLE